MGAGVLHNKSGHIGLYARKVWGDQIISSEALEGYPDNHLKECRRMYVWREQTPDQKAGPVHDHRKLYG
jgi:hypothetical protein